MDVQIEHGALWTRALRIFGSETKAHRWFHTKLSELADHTPGEMLEQSANTESVDAVLDRIEYGVFS